MSLDPIPMQDGLTRRWRMEKVAALTGRVGLGLAAVAVVCLLALLFVPPAQWLLIAALAIMGAAWLAGAVALAIRFVSKPSTSVLAKRADHVFKFKDDLLALSELEKEGAGHWKETTQRQAEEKLTATQIAQAWPVRWSRATLGSVAAAVLFTALVGFVTWQKHQDLLAQAAALEAAKAERLAAADEVLKDWKQFVELTDDEELKKLFAETENLQRALENPDPMAAMLEMNRIEQKMNALEKTISQDSLGSQAAAMAEALESFEGMAAMSAALRNKNFEAAAEEAQKLAAQLEKNKDGQTALRRQQAVAEMLAASAQASGQKGNNQLSQALSQMSDAAKNANNGSVSNQQLGQPSKTLGDQFNQESMRQNRGRAAGLGKQQMDSLRRKLRGEQNPSECQSLCNSGLCKNPGDKPGNGKGGLKAGKGSGGDPRGDQTQLAEAGVEESVTGQATDGESETRTLSATSGAGGSVADAKPANFSDYKELSEKAVADENLPLAHRMVIRAYFERIRPVAESNSP